MIYGLYESATGVMMNSYRQDVIANNLANAQTAGFKKDLTVFKQRLTASQEQLGKTSWSDPLLDNLGGGAFAMPSTFDNSPGTMEPTGNSLDAGINGTGYFAVDDNGQQRLTRNGSFQLDNTGTLILANGSGQKVLDGSGNPIVLNPAARDATTIANDGTVNQLGQPVAKLGVFDVQDPSKLKKEGGTLLSGASFDQLTPSTSQLVTGTVEDSNVDPSTEMASLMETQRQLEANANMIHYQDQTLDKLVNQVGKIS